MQRAPGRVPAFLLAGFRPFFLLAAVAAVVAMVRTLLVLSGLAPAPLGGPVAWHGHELLFAYAAAAAAGFLLTAIPNWTGTAPVSGLPLALLAAIWLTARVGLWYGDPAAWAVAADVAFLPAMALVATRPLWREWRPRAWLPVAVALALAGANALWHAGVALSLPALTERALGFAAMLLALLIAIIGGRITPAFTRNRMQAAGAARLPRPAGMRDAVAIAASAAVALAELVHPATAAGIAVVAAPAHGLRLLGWRGTWAFRDPLLFVLHVGYGWLAVGYAIRAAGAFPGLPGLPGLPGGAWALHGILVGAVGTMTLAVMTRATLGHTGRALQAGAALAFAFAAMQGAAVARLAAPWVGTRAWIAAGALWCVAFGVYLVYCGPMLLRAGRAQSESGRGKGGIPRPVAQR